MSVLYFFKDTLQPAAIQRRVQCISINFDILENDLNSIQENTVNWVSHRERGKEAVPFLCQSTEMLLSLKLTSQLKVLRLEAVLYGCWWIVKANGNIPERVLFWLLEPYSQNLCLFVFITRPGGFNSLQMRQKVKSVTIFLFLITVSAINCA